MQNRTAAHENEGTEQAKQTADQNTEQSADKVKESAREAQETASEKMKQAQDKVNETTEGARETVANAAEQGREKAASGLEGVSDAVREQMDNVQSQVGKVTESGERAAGSLKQASDYLKNATGEDILRDATAFMRANPSQTLAIGIIGGFILGKALRTGSVRKALSDAQSGD